MYFCPVSLGKAEKPGDFFGGVERVLGSRLGVAA